MCSFAVTEDLHARAETAGVEGEGIAVIMMMLKRKEIHLVHAVRRDPWLVFENDVARLPCQLQSRG